MIGDPCPPMRTPHRRSDIQAQTRYSNKATEMTDAVRIEALLALVVSDRGMGSERAPQLAILGLVEKLPKAGYRPTRAGWALMGERGRAFRAD